LASVQIAACARGVVARLFARSDENRRFEGRIGNPPYILSGSGHFTILLLVACLALSASASDIATPMPRQSAGIVIRANEAERWQQGSYEVWVLRGECQLTQDSVTARGQTAVLWVNRAEPFSSRTSKVLAYLEGNVNVDYGHNGPAHRRTGRSADSIRDGQWLGRFHTSTSINIQAPLTSSEPRVKPAIFFRAQQAREAEAGRLVQQTQYSSAVPSASPRPASGPSSLPALGSSVGPAPMAAHEFLPAPTAKPRPTARRVVVSSRSNVRLQGFGFKSPDGSESINVFTSGVKIIVDGIQNVQDYVGDKVDVEADRIVLWTASLDSQELGSQSSMESLQSPESPLEFYMEGNIVFREGDRVIYAERMYYNAREQYGIVLNAEVLSPAPGYQGLVRLKADVLQQLDEHNFRAFGAAITSSRMGVPRYWLQAENVDFRDVQTPQTDPFTGQTAIDPITQEPAVEHQYLTTSRNNFVFIGGVPVLYWPVMATDLEKPTYYVDAFRVNNDSVFGLHVSADLDMYHLLGLRNAPDGTKWTVSPHYLSERGLGLGTNYRYDRFGFFRIPGPVQGELDAWGLKDSGLDNLGRDRRAVPLDEEFRGRVRWQHRQYLPNGFQFTGEVGLISDRNFLEQYHENEWDEFKDQATGLELKRLDGNSSWSIASGMRVNDFFTQTEWLPRFDHFLLGQSILGYLNWSAHSHVGYARLRTAEGLPPPPAAAVESPQAYLPWETDATGTPFDDRSGVRGATRHEVDLPLPLGPFKVAPYALGELAYWDQDRDGNSVRRAYGQAGVRASVPIWKANPQVQNMLFNLNGLAHKVVLDADFFWADANRDLDRLPLYDPLDDDATEHFRRRFLADPLVFGGALPARFDERFYALRTGMQNWVTASGTEIADDLTVLKAGIRQRWQTKRGFPGQQRVIDWIVFDVEGAFFPKPDRDNFGEDVGLFNYNFRWHVGDRFTLFSDGFADIFPDGLRTVAVGGMLSRPMRGDVSLSYRYIDGLFSSNIVSAAVSYRMSEKWILNGGGSIDFGSTGSIGEAINFTRIGESVLIRVGLNVDHSRDNVGIAFSIEPRFLPGSLGSVGGVPIPPVGAFGLE